MQVVHAIRFNRAERHLIMERGLPHVGVGLPDYDPAESIRDAREVVVRTLRYVASGDAVPRAKVEEALEVVCGAMRRCAEQGKPEWWSAQVTFTRTLDPRAAGLSAVEREAMAPGMPLVANVEQFARDMAANRRSQAQELEHVADLLRVALANCPTDRLFDEDGELGVPQHRALAGGAS